MNKEEFINNVLNSISGIKRAEPKPFIYTRIMGRLQKQEKNAWYQVGRFLSRPLIAIACLTAIIGSNIYFIYKDKQVQEAENAAIVASAAAEMMQNNDYALALNSLEEK